MSRGSSSISEGEKTPFKWCTEIQCDKKYGQLDNEMQKKNISQNQIHTHNEIYVANERWQREIKEREKG